MQVTDNKNPIQSGEKPNNKKHKTMKTRIRIIELNSGKILYYCEERIKLKERLNIIGCALFPVIGWFAILLAYLTRWEAMDLDQGIIYKEAVFTSLEEAKKFIDEQQVKRKVSELKEKEDKAAKERKEWESKIKKVTKLKYP
jgi:hypothetical protein